MLLSNNMIQLHIVIKVHALTILNILITCQNMGYKITGSNPQQLGSDTTVGRKELTSNVEPIEAIAQRILTYIENGYKSR